MTERHDSQFWCTCECGMVRVELLTDPNTGEPFEDLEISFSMYKTAHHQWPMPWRTRIKAAWLALRGELWADELILTHREACRFRDNLTDILVAPWDESGEYADE